MAAQRGSGDTAKAPAWLEEIAELVERQFSKAGMAPAATAREPLSDDGPWQRWQRVWESLALEAWDGQG
ncbi:MAG TPA: hypothetical protein VKV26_15840 [Dehalococcoidia bacterium]|nr:hypothetical protein [Dehalococcoidia bacterium]